MLDFRSDTVTRPTPEMRRAMADAEVGDDVYQEDPTVRHLEETIAGRLGKEAALFVPSGTMANLIAIRLHCRAGDEFLCEANCHIVQYEQAGYAQVNGVAARHVVGNDGIVTLEQFQAMIRPENVHSPRTKAIALENTHNRGGGRIQPYPLVEQTCRWALDHGMTSHLDGARLFNAVVATGIEAARWAQHFDTVSVCFSKGLAAPVGSALCGAADWIAEARRFRKVLGGGMRQAGVLAAAAIFALEHNVERLADDHANARRMADGLREFPPLRLASDRIDTNMVFFDIDPSIGRADPFCQRLASRGLLFHAIGPHRVRVVTHRDVTSDDVDRALQIVRETLETPNDDVST